MQRIESQKYHCPKCKAEPGRPCVTTWGVEAEKVHYGRPDPSPKLRAAFRRAEETLRTSPLHPTAASTGIWIGSEFVSRDESVPYGAWYCPCGESREVLSLAGVVEMNERYAEHAPCRI
jgi:hypothetical protein